MKNRVYHCPICGKTYASLTDMYHCAQLCESKERARESQAEIERANAELDIASKYEKLKAAIAKYNAKYKEYSYELVLKHEGPTLAASSLSATATAKNKESVDLAKLLNSTPPLNYPLKGDTTKETKVNNKEPSKGGLEDFLKSNLGIGES